MTGATIRHAGRLLFGAAWRSPFCACFQLGDVSLRRMCKNKRVIPPSLALEIEQALRERANEIDELLETMLDTPEKLEGAVYGQ